MDAVGINWPGLLTQLISFLILFLLLKKFLYKPALRWPKYREKVLRNTCISSKAAPLT